MIENQRSGITPMPATAYELQLDICAARRD